MAVSDVAIANRALQLLGANAIDDIDDSANPRAISIKTAYVAVRDRLLRKYPWKFAIKRVSIPALGSTDIIEGLNQYNVPNDYCRLLREDETSLRPNEEKDWQVEGGVILTADGPPLKIRYIAKIDNPQLFDAGFDEALAYSLAMNCCKQITGSNTLLAGLAEEMKEVIKEARAAGSFEEPSKLPPEDPWLIEMR